MDIETIKKLIREEIQKYHNDNMLFEFYAFERSDFQDKIEARIPIVFLHWCLIKYNQLINTHCPNINHWKDEIHAQLVYLTRLKIKKNNSYEYRLKAIQQIWDDAEFTTDTYNLALSFERKFKEEHIDINSNPFQEVLKLWQEKCNHIIKLIATNDLRQIQEYLNNF